MELTAQQIASIEELAAKIRDPSTPEAKRYREIEAEIRKQAEPLIWEAEAAEGMAPWQSTTSIATDQSRWHLWPRHTAPRNPYFNAR